MSRILIQKLCFYNYGPYSGKNNIEFSTDKNKPITLIGGMNGAGKTTIINSIILLLYGKRSDFWQSSGMSYKDFLSSCICSAVNEKRAWLELSLEVVNNNESVKLIVLRLWELVNGKINEELKVWVDETEDPYLASNWDYYVEELVPLGVSGLFFFDGEKIAKLAEERETSVELQKAIHSMLGLDIIDRLIMDLKRVASDKEWDVLNKYNKASLQEIKEQAENLYSTKNIINQKVASLNTEISKYRVDLALLEKRYLCEGGKFFEQRARIEEERRNIVDNIGIIKGKLMSIASGALPLMMLKSLLEESRNTINNEDEIYQAKMLYPLLLKLDSRLNKILFGFGLDCSVVEKICKDLFSELSELEALNNESTIFPKSSALRNQINSLNNEIGQNILNNSKELVCSYHDSVCRLEQVDVQLQSDISDANVSDILNNIKEITKKIIKLEDEFKKLLAMQEELDNKKVVLNNRCKDILLSNIQREHGLNETKRIIYYALKSQEIMELFKRELKLKKINILVDNINKSFKRMIGKKSLVSEISIDDSLKISLKNPSGENFPKSQISEGEKQMLAIAFLDGLARSSGRNLPIIIDTPMARLDSTHRLNFVQNYLPFSSHQVVVLSTDEEINNKYLSVLEKHIGRKYLLEYNDKFRTTSIKQGYFDSEAKYFDSQAI